MDVTLVQSINFGIDISNPRNIIDVNGTVFFLSDTDEENGSALWKSNGTQEGTQLVQEFNSNLQNLINVGGTLFFVRHINSETLGADDFTFDFGNNWELWKSDGTTEGTQLISKQEASSKPRYLTVLDEAILYINDDGLWKSDGTTEGTQLIQKYSLDEFGNAIPFYDLIKVGENLFFQNTEGLWRSDGTQEGTLLLKPNLPQNHFSNLVDIDGTLFFKGRDELWQSDGTEEGTQLVKEFDSDVQFVGRVEINDLLSTFEDGSFLFLASDGIHGEELWRTDGTEEGTQLVKDINPEGGSNPSVITYIDGTVYFYAQDGVHGKELWKSDGTEEGTQLLKDINPEGQGNPGFLTSLNETLIFNPIGNEIWKSDGTDEGTQFLIEIDGHVERQFENEGTLYFSVKKPDDRLNGLRELWKTDGTVEGTQLVFSRVNNDPFSNEAISNGKLFFSGVNEASDTEKDIEQLYTLNLNEAETSDSNLLEQTFEDTEELTDSDLTVYRFINNETGIHFYTIDEAEINSFNSQDEYTSEGAAYISVDSLTGQPEPDPIYRFSHKDTGIPLYTIDNSEKDRILNNEVGWDFEGEVFYAYESQVEGTIPIYRFLNVTTGAHLFTPFVTEKNSVENNPNFQSEGIAYYAFPNMENNSLS